MKSTLRRSRRIIFATSLGLLASALALAQAVTPAPAAPANSSNQAVQLDKFEVSDRKDDGLYNKALFRTDEEAPLAFNVIDRIEIERMGVANMDEVFRNLPEATNYGTSLQRESSENNTTGGTTYSSSNVNLRNLGTANTVVLINGRRLTAGASSDISRIPPSAIERIEVLPAAAAAIYGGNALGGAINIILRKDVSGADLTTSYGASTRGGSAAEFSGSVRYSKAFNKGRSNITLLLNYSHRDKFTMGETPILQRAYDRYGPTTGARMPAAAGGGLAFESYILNAGTVFAGMPGFIKSDFATGTAGTSIVSGDSSTHPLGIPGAATAWYAQLPAGLNSAQARALTPAAFTATAGKFNESRQWRGNRTVLYVPSTLYGFTATADHTIIKDKLEAYGEITIALKRDNYTFPTALGFPYGVGFTATDPLNPFRTGVTPGFVGVPIRVYFDPNYDLPDSSTLQERNGASATLGVKGKIGTRWTWTFDANGDYARQGSDANVPINYLQTFVTRPGVTDATTGTRAPTSLAERLALWNPLADHIAFPMAQADINRLFAFNRVVVNYQRTTQLNPRFSGTIYDLPAGPLTTQVRGEVRWEQANSSQFSPHSPDMDTMLGNAAALPATVTRSSSTTKGLGMELVAPIIGRKFRPLPIESAMVQGSVRRNWTNRGRGGDITSLAGQVWLTKEISVRGSLSEGLVPLTVAQILAPTQTDNASQSITDPLRGNIARTVVIPLLLTGGNPGLRNEFSRTRTLGVIFKPHYLGDRLTLTSTYSETKRFDAVAAATAVNILAFPEDFPGRLTRAALTAADTAAGFTGGAITMLDLTQINLAKSYIETFDNRVTLRLTERESALGLVQFTSGSTFTNRFVTQTRPHSPHINNVGAVTGTTVLGPLRWKGSAQLWWSRDIWEAGLTARYTDKYYTDTTAPRPAIPAAATRGLDGDHIGSAVYYDLQVGRKFAYATGKSGWRSWIAGTQWTLNIRNLLDKDPPFRSDQTGGYYSRFDDPRGRVISLQVRKTM